eukprot:TRINITY_DN5934_c0_g1_i2.p1 TRINITY_DN5934_c0_g1~~TRINITY_DN5934_c0_g1_i2.p1  ORF type:complete len:330 (-),score=79.54 TRINITY_DN5934_c0_g1_i2:39-1028(-)
MPYTFTPSGSFTEDDLRISKEGMKIGDAAKPPESKFRLDDFQDLGVNLGQGSSGYVKKYLHKPSGKEMAIKIMQLDVNEEVRRKILMELRTLHLSSHESIVEFYDAFYSDGSIFLALEYMDCGNLADVLKQVGKIPENVLGKITDQLLRGIEYIHKELHVVHRDIKPSNLLLNSKGEVKITDFGVSGKLANTIAKAQTFVGTVTYMSPERIKAEDHASNSDIWSLGLSILECALGYYPYRPPGSESQGLTFFELLEDIQTNPAPRVPTTGFSPEFADFIEKCLVKDPSKRPNATDLVDHPFLKKYENDPIDFAAWLRSTLAKMGKITKK